MSSLNITLKRSPRSLIVGNNTIMIELARPEDEPTLEHDSTSAGSAGNQWDPSGGESAGRGEFNPVDSGAGVSKPAAGDSQSSSPPRGAGISMPTSIGHVIADPVGKALTPLGQSNAVPVLAGATHEVVTAEEIGLGGVTEEEFSELKSLLANVAEMVMELQEQHRQSLGEMQEVAVELASAAASWLVGYAIERNMFAVDDLIRKALHQLEADQPVRVRLNPADHELLQSLMHDAESRELLANVSCIDDPAMSRGSCRVESGRRILLSDMNSRLDDVRRSWMEKLDDTQVERRGNGTAASALRRFPDRRETA